MSQISLVLILVDFCLKKHEEEGNSSGKVIGKVQLFSGLARSMANCRIVLFLLLNTFGNIPTMRDVLQILL